MWYFLSAVQGNIIISGGEPTQVIEPEKGIVIDNFLLDLENKKISCLFGDKDSFLDGLQDIDKVQVKSAEDKKGKIIEIYLKDKEKPVIIGIDNDNQITKYENQYLKQVGDYFLKHNRALRELNLPQLENVGWHFLYHNRALTEVNLPQLENVGGYFLYSNRALTKVNLPQLKEAGDCFLCENRALTKLNLPQLKQVGNYFLYSNRALTKLNLPQLENVGDRFLRYNEALREVNLPQIPELESKLKNIAIKNQPKKEEITPTDIAVLDRKSELTTSEIEDVKNNKKIEKTSKDERDVSR